MSEIEDLYVIEWMGPYESLNEVYDRENSEYCCIYLITGKLPYDRKEGIKYVGITKQFVSNRLIQKDHIEKQEKIRDKKFWIAKFSKSAFNDLNKERNRAKAELVEYLLVRYLSNLPKSKMINQKKTMTDPPKPIVVISRGQRKYTEEERYNKPSALSQLPDVLMYVDKKFYTSDKLRCTLYTED